MFQKIQLYIISLILLFVLLFINKINLPICYEWNCNCEIMSLGEILKTNPIPAGSLFFILLGLFFYWNFDYKFGGAAPELSKKVVKVENLNFETLSFLATYIIPLVCFDLDFDLDKNRNLLMLILVLILLGAIYIKTNIFYTNPTLALLGYRIYKVDSEKTKDMIVIIKGKIVEGDSILTVPIDENIHLAKSPTIK